MVVPRITIALDTNVFISVINKESGSAPSKKILDWIEDGRIKCIVSTIVLADICSGYSAGPDGQKEKDEFLAQILGSSSYEIADVSANVATHAGNLRSSLGFKLPDALIIASALHHNVEILVTNDYPVGKAVPEGLRILTPSEFAKDFERSIRNEPNPKR